MTMDEISRYNRERWNELARAGVEYSRPWLDLDEGQARRLVDPHGLIGEMRGKDVLCLAGAGGQQSIAFALLGARPVVLDLSDEMLAVDRKAASQLGYDIRYEQGDMRDLSRFSDDSFDVVWHAYSITFVPQAGRVFDEVRRVLRPGGIYHTQFSNPFTFGVDEREWTGKGYLLRMVYTAGTEHPNPVWDFIDGEGRPRQMTGPREFRHTMSEMLNGLAQRGFVLLGLWEEASPNPEAEPGTWEHYLAVCVPILHLWMSYRPGISDQWPVVGD